MAAPPPPPELQEVLRLWGTAIVTVLGALGGLLKILSDYRKNQAAQGEKRKVDEQASRDGNAAEAGRLRDELRKEYERRGEELNAAQDEALELRYRYMGLLSAFERLRNDVLRALETAVTRLEVGHDQPRVIALLEGLKKRIEDIKLPELPD